MISSEDLVDRLGSLIVVTGANGFIASHVAHHALTGGFRVRGAVRNIKNAAWCKNISRRSTGTNNFELIEVPKMESEEAFGNAVKEATAIAHAATPLMRSLDPN
jgi:nucleoside-diphosphate-sugar epimerase